MGTTIIKVSQKELLSVMKVTGKIIQPGSKSDVSNGRFRMKTDGEKLLVTGSDSFGSVTGTVECIEIIGNVDFCIDSSIMMEILKQIPDQPLTIEVREKKMRVEYFPGSFEIPTFDAELFPTVNVNAEAKRLELDSLTLEEGLSLAIRSIGGDELKPVMGSVFMELQSGILTFVGTDANILSYREFSIESKDQISAIIPGRAAKLITSVLPVCAEKIEVAVSPRTISFESNGYKFVYLLSEGRYPNYRGIIPKNNLHVEVNRRELIGALRRSSVLTNSPYSMISLSLDYNKMTIECEDKEFRQSAHESIDIDYNKEELTIGLNAEKLITLLSGIDSDRSVLHFSDPSRSVLINPFPEKKGITLLIMPIHIGT